MRGEQNPYARYITEGFKYIDHMGLDEEVPDSLLLEGAMRGMIAVLEERGDRYSHYLSKNAAQQFKADIFQEYVGIGIPIGLEGEPQTLTIVGMPEPGSPADQAGLTLGDRILKVDKKQLLDFQ